MTGYPHMSVRFNLLCLLVAIIASSHCSAQCDSAALAKADTLFVHKKFKAATKAYQKLVDRQNCMAYAYRGLAGCAQALHEPTEKMVGLMNQAVALAPTDPDILLSRSNAYKYVGMYDRSLADLQAAMPYLKNDSVRGEFLTDQADDLMDLRRFDEARAVMEQGYALDSLSPGVLNNLALVCNEQGRHEEAYAWMEKFIALDTTDLVGYLNMGFMLATNEHYSEALGYYEKAGKRGAKGGRFFNNRGYAKLMTGDADGALADIETSIKLFPSNSYAYRNRGLAYRKLGRYDESCTAFETALALGYTKQYGNDVKQVYDAYCH